MKLSALLIGAVVVPGCKNKDSIIKVDSIVVDTQLLSRGRKTEQ